MKKSYLVAPALLAVTAVSSCASSSTLEQFEAAPRQLVL